MALAKEKLTIQLQTQLSMSKREAQQMVSRLFYMMKDTPARGEDLLISGFGKFSVRQKKAQRGRKPQTKENMILTAQIVLVFKTSVVLRKRINEGFKMPD
jgi:integration host factor subunit alpha